MATVKCTCCSQWEINPRCAVHGYIKPSTPLDKAMQVSTEDLFLKSAPVRSAKPSAKPELQDLLYAIIDRAEIGRSIAILEDEVDNFNFIVQLANEALTRL